MADATTSSAESGAGSTTAITITVKSQKERESFQIEPNDDVKSLRDMVAQKFNVEPAAVCLIFSGKILRDGGTINSHHLENGHIVHMVIRDAKSAPQASATTNTTSSSTASSNNPSAAGQAGTNTSTTSNPTPGSGGGTGTGAPGGMFDLFNSMMGNNLFGGAAGAGAGTDAAGAAGGFPNNEMFSQMLNNPMIEQMANNPELIQSIISNTPGFRDIMDRNPELGQMLRSPELFRQSLNLMRNPAAMQEMMRNRDRAMSNLESMPGGFNALRRMYTEMEEPMFQALSSRSPFESTNNGNQNANSAPSTTENRDPLPNPWDRSASAGAGNNNNNNAGGNRSSSLPFNPADLLGGANIQDMVRQMTSNPDTMRNIMSSMGGMLGGGGGGGAGAGGGAGGLGGFGLDQLSNQMGLMQRIMGNPEAFQALMDIQSAHARLERALGVSLVDLVSGNVNSTGASSGTTTTTTNTTSTPSDPAATNTTNTTTGANTTSSPATNPSSATGGQTPANMFANMNQIMSMLGALGQGGQGGGQGGLGGLAGLGGLGGLGGAQNQQPPEERFASQLQQLEGMGFTNRERNIRALQQTFGNVEAAIEIILSGL